MKSTFKLLFALLLALGLGVVASTANSAFLQRLANYVEPLGSVWIGFLKMVIIPLLISLLVTSVASKGTHEQTTPLLKRILLVFVGLYIVTLLVSMLIVPILLQLLPSSFTLAGNEGDAASLASGKPLSFIDQLLGWVPENPFKSAAEGAILPVVIFSLFFGLALNHVAEAGRNTVLDFFRGVGDAMLKIVEWLLVVAPLGIFCIVFPLTSRAGAQMVNHWKLYDISMILRQNWRRLQPDLQNKVLVTVGNDDNFFLNESVKLLEEEAIKLNTGFVFTYYSGDHFTLTSPEYNLAGYRFLQQKYNEFVK
jgi:Na+/H+-dicarboxylate symporter